MSEDLYLGIDVGTGSARAGVFDRRGQLVASAAAPIKLFRPKPDFAEHSSADIWETICRVTKAALAESGITADRVAGIGFDATCSLVAVDASGGPVSVSPTGEDAANVIVWLDHRAIGQAKAIDQTGHDILRFTGNTISPEMELPKLLWLRENLPEQFARAAYFFDLPDWLVYRATGAQTRSLCSATCKWTYQGSKGLHGEGWDRDFLTTIGLGDLTADNCARIGNEFAEPGQAIGAGLSADAAAELGLKAGTKVAASLIDAYSGALGTLGVRVAGQTDGPAGGRRLALISGTSACHISTTKAAAFVPGVWGPYFSVLEPGLWANEAGQSAAGALIDRIIEGHGAASALKAKAKAAGCSIFDLLDGLLKQAAGTDDATHRLAAAYHIQPDFHGNRAPLADPTRRGAVVGLTLAADETDLALQYLATLQALAYGTRQIIETLNQKGVGVDTIVVSGGLARNQLYLREHADATGCRILIPDQQEPVLLGSAMLGAVAAGAYGSVNAAMSAMSGTAKVVLPRPGAVAAFHDAKYRVFQRMQSDFAAYRDIMQSIEES